MPLFLVFVLTPLAEIIVLLQVGSYIGVGPTILCILFTAFLGIYLLKRQGLSTLLRARSKMANNELPARELGEAVLLAFAGALLLTPGFITDSLGFALLVPAIRNHILQRWVLPRIVVYRSHTEYSGQTIEGEFRRDD